jgi:hypothetical protein
MPVSTSHHQPFHLTLPPAIPPFALWCRAAAQSVCKDPAAVMHLIVGDDMVKGLGRTIGDGTVRVGIAGGWRWPTIERDLVGEFVLRQPDGLCGLQLIGWWSPADPQPSDHPDARSVLEMDVAGITLWDGSRHVSTEDGARIAALLH